MAFDTQPSLGFGLGANPPQMPFPRALPQQQPPQPPPPTLGAMGQQAQTQDAPIRLRARLLQSMLSSYAPIPDDVAFKIASQPGTTLDHLAQLRKLAEERGQAELAAKLAAAEQDAAAYLAQQQAAKAAQERGIELIGRGAEAKEVPKRKTAREKESRAATRAAAAELWETSKEAVKGYLAPAQEYRISRAKAAGTAAGTPTPPSAYQKALDTKLGQLDAMAQRGGLSDMEKAELRPYLDAYVGAASIFGPGDKTVVQLETKYGDKIKEIVGRRKELAPAATGKPAGKAPAEILVERISDGQRGYLLETDFDSSKYRRVK